MDINRSLEILASSAQKQQEYLLDIGTYPSADELALEFEDAYFLFATNCKNINDLLSESLLNDLDIINDMLDGMSKPANKLYWDVSYLNNKEWSEIRSFAENILKKYFIEND